MQILLVHDKTKIFKIFSGAVYCKRKPGLWTADNKIGLSTVKSTAMVQSLWTGCDPIYILYGRFWETCSASLVICRDAFYLFYLVFQFTKENWYESKVIDGSPFLDTVIHQMVVIRWLPLPYFYQSIWKFWWIFQRSDIVNTSDGNL